MIMKLLKIIIEIYKWNFDYENTIQLTHHIYIYIYIYKANKYKEKLHFAHLWFVRKTLFLPVV